MGMENDVPTAQTNKTDIAEQAYKGPGAAIASIGYGMVDFKISTLASAALGVAISMVAPKGTATALNTMEANVTRWNQKGGLLKPIGWSGQKFVELGKWCEANIPFKDKLHSWVGNERWEPVSRLTGMLGSLGFVATFFTGAGRGINAANAGKSQLREAQNEIKALRKAIAEEHSVAVIPQAANSNEPATTITTEGAEHTPLAAAPAISRS